MTTFVNNFPTQIPQLGGKGQMNLSQKTLSKIVNNNLTINYLIEWVFFTVDDLQDFPLFTRLSTNNSEQKDMQQIRTFSDGRLEDHCIYCGDRPSTRDHIPSKVILDEPFPENLPVVPACFQCNNGLSLDEVYFACLVECAICGTTDIDKLQRTKVKTLLQQNNLLHQRLNKAKLLVDEKIFFEPEQSRVRNVVLKHARGIVKYEYSECPLEDPAHLILRPIPDMTNDELNQFYSSSAQPIFPEIGSRAFRKMVEFNNPTRSSWIVVQEGAFKYIIGLTGGIQVKFVIREYLACEAYWN